MKMMNEIEMNLVNGGLNSLGAMARKHTRRQRPVDHRAEWQNWVEQEKRKAEGLAALRMRESEDNLRAAMRLNEQENNIREAMRAQHEALGLD